MNMDFCTLLLTHDDINFIHSNINFYKTITPECTKFDHLRNCFEKIYSRNVYVNDSLHNYIYNTFYSSSMSININYSLNVGIEYTYIHDLYKLLSICEENLKCYDCDITKYLLQNAHKYTDIYSKIKISLGENALLDKLLDAPY